MIRPIDTQILHPQTPEIAGRQQRNNHMPVEQQAKYGDIMKKEVAHKKDTVVEAQNPEHLKTKKDQSKQPSSQNHQGSKQKKKDKSTKAKSAPKSATTKIDIRI